MLSHNGDTGSLALIFVLSFFRSSMARMFHAAGTNPSSMAARVGPGVFHQVFLGFHFHFRGCTPWHCYAPDNLARRSGVFPYRNRWRLCPSVCGSAPHAVNGLFSPPADEGCILLVNNYFSAEPNISMVVDSDGYPCLRNDGAPVTAMSSSIPCDGHQNRSLQPRSWRAAQAVDNQGRQCLPSISSAMISGNDRSAPRAPEASGLHGRDLLVRDQDQ